mgnify:CR=1 FL=1|jgi:hypothetical protein
MSITSQLEALLSNGNCPVDGDGNFIPPPTDDAVAKICSNFNPALDCTNDVPNPAWELTESDDSCLIDSYINESIQIGGAVVNVHRLLGVHEQGSLQDLTGSGSAISNGDNPNFPASNAFDLFQTQWRSTQYGPDVMSSYIGYDFGEILLDNNRKRYGVETFVKFDVSSIKIRQGCRKENRVTKARVERSNDGVKWYGVQVVDFPDCEGAAKVNFKRSVPSRFWRLRPVAFNGGANDGWEVQAIQLLDYEATDVNNIQDRILLENRDRDYDENPIRMKGSYTPVDVQAFQSKHGFGSMYSGNEWVLEISFSSTISVLGRPFVIGDIIQLPAETQFTASLKPIKRYLEITDVAWSTNSYTPNWIPTMQRLIAKPVMASQETQDVMGKLTEDQDELGLVDINDGSNDKQYQDFSEIAQTIEADGNTLVPQNGIDYADIADVSAEFYEWTRENSGTGSDLVARRIDAVRSQYGYDAMPPNGEAYTQADEFPPNPKDGAYHRLTYTSIRSGIPARLHRFSVAKNNWVFLEKDRRALLSHVGNNVRRTLREETSTVTPPDDKDAYLDDET